MQIIVDGMVAAIKEGSSFDFIAENRLFSGSDSYTLTITFPLKECPENILIFGNIYRSEIPVSHYRFDCEIRDRAFIRFGTLTLIEVTEAEVKGQFLEGRSEQNFDNTFDKIYINELTLGSTSVDSASSITPEDAWDPATNNYESVALPWVSADSGTPHNFADYDTASGTYSWSEDVIYLSWQPYLLHITKKICDAIGYTYQFESWEEDAELSKILICNALPDAWDLPDYARALPHWTVDEYFEKLELFLAGEFTIDHREKTVSFSFIKDVLEDTPPVSLDSVVDEYSSNIKVDGGDCDYLETRNLAYKDAGHQMSKFYACDWFIGSSNPLVYPDIISLLNSNSGIFVWDGGNHRGSNRNRLFYVEDLDQYFIIRAVSRELVESRPAPLGDIYSYKCILQPVNEFGERKADIDEDADTDELEFVPACVDYTEDKYGFCLFLNFSSYSEDADGSVSTADLSFKSAKERADAFQKPGAQQMLEAGERGEKSEYYSTVYIAYYSGFNPDGYLPHPFVSNIVLDYENHNVSKLPFNLRLNDAGNSRRAQFYHIDQTRKVTFKFLSDDLPSPRALYYINGRKYICEKITATFSDFGMSQLLKGEFFPLLDD